MFNRVVTFFHKTKDGCEKHVINDVFYDEVKSISLESKGEKEANSIKLVIPVDAIGDEREPQEGDYVCKGYIESDYVDLTSMLQSEPAHLIVACDKRDYGSNPHYLITGR